MSIHKRPFAGTWNKTVQNKELRRHVPDVIVKFNGETSYPSCAGCSGSIDLQDLITSVSVSNSTDTSPANVSISMSIPTNRYACLFRDNKFVLHPGLEVHVYLRGFFSSQELVGDLPTIQQERKQRQDEDPNLTAEENALPTTGEKITEKLSHIPMKPYYQVFHGVITQADFSYGGGFYECSLTANDLFHFWQYQNINTNPSALGSKVSGDKTRMNYVGGKHVRQNAYSVIFDLYSSKHGDAGAQDFVLSDFTNIGIKSDLYQDSFWDVTGWYWSKRFEQPMSKLKMYGADGRQFTTLEQLAVADPQLVKSGMGKASAGHWLSVNNESSSSKPTGLHINKVLSILRSANPDYAFPVSSLYYVQQTAFALYKDGKFKGDQGLKGDNIAAQTAFAQELGSMGQVNIFEAQVTTKMDIASTVCTESGFEFFIDMNGDYVFKPPLYNLDTSDSRVYTIKAIDLISFSNTESEPTATVMKGTGGYFANWGSLLGSEFENRGMYVDWKLVAKYGWREADFSTTFLNDPKSIYYACINRLYLENKEVQSGSVTIPLRPEMKLGFPIYIEPFDCFYYVNSISHSFSFGGECTTDLGLIAKRSKFFPPMKDWDSSAIPTLENLDFENIYRTSRPLYTRVNGLPKLMGIPNVVMALDVSLVNPLWAASGEITAEMMNVTLNLKDKSAGGKNYEQVRIFLREMSSAGYLTFKGAAADVVVFYNENGEETSPISLVTVTQIFASLFVATERARSTTDSWERGEFNSYVELYESQPDLFTTSFGAGDVDTNLFKTAKGGTKKELTKVERLQKASIEGGDSIVGQDLAARSNGNGGATFTLFLKALDAYRLKHFSTPFGNDRTPIQNYLSAMSFMKSSFRPDDMQPGAYRYYTDAIPKTHSNYATIQGQANSSLTQFYDGQGVASFNTLVTNPQRLETPLPTTKVLENGDGTFRISVPNQDPTLAGSSPIYETEYGIKVLVPRGTEGSAIWSRGEKTDKKTGKKVPKSLEAVKVIPTSQIKTIVFSVPRLSSRVTSYAYELNNFSVITGTSDWSDFFLGLNGEANYSEFSMGLVAAGTVDMVQTFLGILVRDFEDILTESQIADWKKELEEITSVRYEGFCTGITGREQVISALVIDLPFMTAFGSEDPDIAQSEDLIIAVRNEMANFCVDKYEIVLNLLDKNMLDAFKAESRNPTNGIDTNLENASKIKRENAARIRNFWGLLDDGAAVDGFLEQSDFKLKGKTNVTFLAELLNGYDFSPITATDIPLDEKLDGTQNPLGTGLGEFFYSPVLPVSDNKGFEHFGTYAYGRDYNLKTFAEVLTATPDVWSNLAPSQMADFVSALSDKSTSPENAMYQVILDDKSISGETRLGLANILAESLSVESTGQDIPPQLQAMLDNGSLTGEEILKYAKEPKNDEEKVARMFDLQFRNDMLKVTREYGANYEISTENVPISLAQLDKEYAPFQCSGAAGANALDKSYGFQVTNTVQTTGLDIAAYVQSQSATTLADWRLRQEALRGNPVPDGSSGLTLQSGDDAISGIVDLFSGDNSITEQSNVLGEDIGNAIGQAIQELSAIDEEDN